MKFDIDKHRNDEITFRILPNPFYSGNTSDGQGPRDILTRFNKEQISGR